MQKISAKPSKQLTQIAKQTKTRKLKVSLLNIYGGMFYRSKARNYSEAKQSTQIKALPHNFYGGALGPTHKNGGEESLAEYPS